MHEIFRMFLFVRLFIQPPIVNKVRQMLFFFLLLLAHLISHFSFLIRYVLGKRIRVKAGSRIAPLFRPPPPTTTTKTTTTTANQYHTLYPYNAVSLPQRIRSPSAILGLLSRLHMDRWPVRFLHSPSPLAFSPKLIDHLSFPFLSFRKKEPRADRKDWEAQ